MATETQSEFEKFDSVVRKLLAVPHKEIEKRERAWKRKRAAKKRTKTSPASRASGGKD
jgi:hypothetical protein